MFESHIASTRHTQRLILRAPIAADAQSTCAIHCDPRTNQFNPSPPTREYVLEMLSRWLAHWQQHGYGYWAVALRDKPEQLIGFGGIIFKPSEGLPDLNLYFRLTPTAWGNGYATELARAALHMAFDELAAPAVRGIARLSNTPSRATLKKLGFIETGIHADPEVPKDYEPSVVYQINAVQWREAKPH